MKKLFNKQTEPDSFKIIKREIHSTKFDGEIYGLSYPIYSYMGLVTKWKVFPIYFINRKVLEDFIECSYIFNYRYDDLLLGDISIDYVLHTKDFSIRFSNIVQYLDVVVFTDWSRFRIVEKCADDIKKFSDDLLSKAYKKYLNDARLGLSEIKEEKMYKLILTGND